MRLLPGDGELPLAEFLAALPVGIPPAGGSRTSLQESLTPVEACPARTRGGGERTSRN